MTSIHTSSATSATSATSRSVVITGANGGMGQACCQLLHAQGWHVLALDHAFDSLQDLVASPRFTTLACDLRDESLPAQVQAALQPLPTPTGLVNLVGKSVGHAITELDDEDWQESFSINVTPAMRLTRLLAPGMKAQGGGSIVNVGSPVGIIGARKPSYAASKAALLGLTMSCARNLGGDNIRANLLLPGPTITKMTADWSEEKRHSIAQGTFLKRLCKAEEVAKTIAFLLGSDSAYITGSVIDMTAGSMYGH